MDRVSFRGRPRRRALRRVPLVLSFNLAVLAAACGGSADDTLNAQVLTAAGPDAEAIRAKVDAYKAIFGADNGGEPGQRAGGFRAINWDSVPDDQAAPAFLAPDFFNASTAPRARGAVLITDGQGVQASGTAQPRFSHVNAAYLDDFKTFSGARLFSPIGSNVVDLTFRVPGTTTPAAVRGFGAVYTDVDTDHTAFVYFDAAGKSLGAFKIPRADRGLSFLGVAFAGPVVSRVRISYGTAALGKADGAGNDVAVMDDFIYGEPQPLR